MTAAQNMIDMTANRADRLAPLMAADGDVAYTIGWVQGIYSAVEHARRGHLAYTHAGDGVPRGALTTAPRQGLTLRAMRVQATIVSLARRAPQISQALTDDLGLALHLLPSTTPIEFDAEGAERAAQGYADAAAAYGLPA